MPKWTDVPGAVTRVVGNGTIWLVRADITTLECDAIVNAANAHLVVGGGVDGAIHRAGGPEIFRETNAKYDGCPTGSAVISGAGRLPCRYVIHAVGPRWRDGNHGEPGLLRSAYTRAFQLAAEYHCSSVALPSIATGIYGFPTDKAAPIAFECARTALHAGRSVCDVAWALFDAATFATFEAALQHITP